MPSGRSSARTPILLALAAVLLVGAGAFLFIRSRTDSAPSATERAERQRSCAPLLVFASSLDDVTISLSAPSATIAPRAVEELLVKAGGAEALVDTAPAKARNDVRDLVGSLRASPTDPATLRSAEFDRARQRLRGYLADPASGCQAGAASGDG